MTDSDKKTCFLNSSKRETKCVRVLLEGGQSNRPHRDSLAGPKAKPGHRELGASMAPRLEHPTQPTPAQVCLLGLEAQPTEAGPGRPRQLFPLLEVSRRLPGNWN